MKALPAPKTHRAFTLIEVTVVISMLISLISLLATSARAWKRGADRSGCLMSQRNIQVAVRSYQNLNGYDYGMFHPTSGGTSDIAEQLYRKELLGQEQYELARGQRTCDGGGQYTRPDADRFPLPGQLYAACPLVDPEIHAPAEHSAW